MLQSPELLLWRCVLFNALRAEDAREWLRRKDAEIVCALAGVDVEGVRRAWSKGRVRRAGIKVR